MRVAKIQSEWKLNSVKEPGSRDANSVNKAAAHLALLIETGVPVAL